MSLDYVSKPLIQGSKLRPIQSHLRLKFSPLRLKYLEKSQISDLFLRLLFRNKRITSCQFAATLIKKERNKKIVLFLSVNFRSI